MNVIWQDARAAVHRMLIDRKLSRSYSGWMRRPDWLAVFALVLLLPVSHVATAATFWVLGSFTNEDRARAEGIRLSESTGIEVLLHESIQVDRVRYRVMTGVLQDESDRESLKAQLIASGAPLPWAISFETLPFLETLRPQLQEASSRPVPDEELAFDPASRDYPDGIAVMDEELARALQANSYDDDLSAAELAEIDALLQAFDDQENSVAAMFESNIEPGSDTYIVLGSFSSMARAESELARIEAEYTGAIPLLIARAGNDEASYHRVMAGPMTGHAQPASVQQFGEFISGEPWLLQAVKVAENGSAALVSSTLSTSDQLSGANADRADNADTEMRKPQVRTWPGENDAFNAARLNTAAKWPDPRK